MVGWFNVSMIAYVFFQTPKFCLSYFLHIAAELFTIITLEDSLQIASILYITYGFPVLLREPWSILCLIHAGSLYFRYIFLDLGLMALMRGVPARVALSPSGFSSCAVLPALLVSCVLLCSCLGVCLAACPSSSVSSQLYTSSRMLSKDPHPCTVHGWAHWRCWMVVGRE